MSLRGEMQYTPPRIQNVNRSDATIGFPHVEANVKKDAPLFQFSTGRYIVRGRGARPDYYRSGSQAEAGSGDRDRSVPLRLPDALSQRVYRRPGAPAHARSCI